MSVFSVSYLNVNYSFQNLVQTQWRVFVLEEQFLDEDSRAFVLWEERSRVAVDF